MLVAYIFTSFILGMALGLLIKWQMNKVTTQYFEKNITFLQNDIAKKQQSLQTINAELAVARLEAEYAVNKAEEQRLEIINMKEQFTLEFENLANRIFDEKSAKFSLQNQMNLSNLLVPLGEKIRNFEKQVADSYNTEGKERRALKEQIQMLTQLNQQMSFETQNLTLALKGDSKMQGNWGEMILESILEKSGLVKDREYLLQQSHLENDGKRYQPDVVIKLPQDKMIVIDAKVSLTAYARFTATHETTPKETALKEHLLSLKNHIKDLSSKNYQNLAQVANLDFVLLFIPIESAFALALQHDATLFDEALAKNIVVVCPSTLLATLRTIASIWRSEKSAGNANEIAKIGGELHDRLVAFINSLELINTSLLSAQTKYNDALTKLSGNRGVLKSALKLKELGAKTSKIFETKWTDN